LFNGLVGGLVIGLLAMGIVLIYRSTSVINFAVANMGVPSSALLALMVVNYNFAFWPALFIALLVGTLTGAVLELSIIRRLFSSPRVVVLVATIGIAQLLAFVPLMFPDLDNSSGEKFPVAISRVFEGGGFRVTGPQLTILAVVPVIALALSWFLNRTTFGQTVAAAADNPDLARLSGISPKVVSTVVWTVAGLLASLSTIMLSGQSGSLSGLVALGPTTMVRALAAAVIGGMRSFRTAMAAGIAVGVLESLLRFNTSVPLGLRDVDIGQRGLIDFVLFLVIVVAVFFQGRKSSAGVDTYSFVPKSNPVPERLKQLPVVGLLVPGIVMVSIVVAVVLPVLVTTPSRQRLFATIVAYAVIGLSVTVVTGWAGQIALGQMAFAGVGALAAAGFHRAGVAFIPSMLLAALLAAALAMVIGVGALRVKGLMLAVSTFAFGVAAEKFIFQHEFLSDGNRSTVPFPRGTLFNVSLDSQRNYYWLCLATLVFVLGVVVRLRKSGVGRGTIAVRDNEASASAFTVVPSWIKLRAFGLAGFIAGLGGALIGGLLESIPLTDRFFTNADSLAMVAMVVIGGLGSVFGAIIGALWVIGLPALAPDSDVVPFLTSTVGLLFVLLYFPGGFAQRLIAMREQFFGWLASRLPDEPHKSEAAIESGLAAMSFGGSEGQRKATLETSHLAVTFGGNRAVDDVSLHIDEGEVVGLIGTNGAGKSTLMNAIGGFVSSTGEVHLGGEKISALTPAKRASLGLGRTFQAATLFPELTVRETAMVALEARGHTGMLSTALFLPHGVRRDRAQRSQADQLIDFLGLGRYADTYISDLSTGTRRIVELAGLLALDAHVLCLDEPTAGVAQRETEAFGPLLLEIRKELNASILVIEHDMPLIMSISDRVYCMEFGSVIAEGLPEEVRNDPRVVASYLGTDTRAIERSDSGSSSASRV